MTSRPIVALVIDAIHPYSFGGREIRYHELSGYLSQRADVHVFTMHWWDGPPIRTEGQVTFHAISRLLPLYRNGVRSTLQALVFALASLRLLRRRFDVLVVDQIPFFPLLVLRVVAILKRKQLIATWHEVWGPEYWRDYLGTPWRLAWWIEWLAMQAPDHIIAASPETARRLEAVLRARASITIAPNGIDLERVRSAMPAEERTDLVVVSRLMQHKRLDLLLQAVALLHEQGRPVTCRIIGDGPERHALHKQAAELGIAHAVDFRHNVSEQKDVYSLIKAGRVFAFPSTREGFGIAVLEALACEVPVVTTSARDNLAQHLVLRSRRGVVCDHTLPAFAAALNAVLDAPQDGQAKDLWLSEYAWESIASRVTEVLLS